MAPELPKLALRQGSGAFTNKESLNSTKLPNESDALLDFHSSITQKEKKNPISSPLRSPFRNFTFENYPNLQNLIKKLSNCGSDYVTLLNRHTAEQIVVPLHCDNRVCLNPDCQRHRLYKFMREHGEQIKALNRNMRKPKGWVFTTKKRPYPIDRGYCQDMFNLLGELLDKSKHRKYGSNSLSSIHMEIKTNDDSWYLHFHGASGGISNLRLIRQLWGFQIKYESAISPVDLGFYISKYASKVPVFPNKTAYLEYAVSTYKLQMHRFSIKIPPVLRESDWIVIDRECSNSNSTFFELQDWLNKYLNDFGYGS